MDPPDSVTVASEFTVRGVLERHVIDERLEHVKRSLLRVQVAGEVDPGVVGEKICYHQSPSEFHAGAVGNR